MTEYRRYAVYYTPPSGSDLARFGASWLGWDVEAGTPAEHLKTGDFDVMAATKTPRKYGFHGTIKPPFRLASGTDTAMLSDALAELTASVPAFDAPPLSLRRLGPFVALVPAASSTDLAELAGRCVMELDRFRAPPSEAELAKRRAGGLTPEQDALLLKWGYPYVLEEFRFHLTLTGRLNEVMADRAFDVLAPLTALLCTEPMPVHEICLCGEATDGRFHILHRYALAG